MLDCKLVHKNAQFSIFLSRQNGRHEVKAVIFRHGDEGARSVVRVSFAQTLYKGHNRTDSVVIIACRDRGGFRIGAHADWTR